jgi:MFS family permease
VAALLLDVGLLREDRAFRRLWTSSALTAVGTQIVNVALSIHIYRVTGSNLDVGLLGAVQLVPAFVGSSLGGALADATDRRRVLASAAGLAALLAGVLCLLSGGARLPLWPLFVLAGLLAGVQAAANPAQSALLQSIIPRADLLRANVFRSIANQGSIVVGPALAGVVIAAGGVVWALGLSSACFAAPLMALRGLGAHPPTHGTTRFGWRSISEGFTFLRGRPVIQGCIWSDLNATVLGWPTALFPAIGTAHLHGGPRLVGLLFAAPGIGALVGAALSGWTSLVRRVPRAMCAGIVVWGLAIAAFGLSSADWLAIVCLAVAGVSDMITSAFRTTVIQFETPDRLRGRVSAVQMSLLANGPRVGNAEAGAVAAMAGTGFSAVSGGLGCIVGVVVIARLFPSFYRYELTDRRDAEEELAR